MEQDLEAFYLNDESDPDNEFDPEQFDLDVIRFNNGADEETH